MYVDGKFVWKELEIEIKPYVDAIALGGPLHSLVQELAKREAEMKEITNRLTSASAGSIDSRLQEIQQFVTAGISDLRSLLEREPVLAKAELHNHLSEVRMIPTKDTTLRRQLGICLDLARTR